MRFFLMVLVYLSPIFIVRMMWPRLYRRNQPPHYCMFAAGAMLGAIAAVWGLASFVIAWLGLTSQCTNAWQCDIAQEFDAHLWWFLGYGLTGVILSYLLFRLSRCIARTTHGADR
jgi:dipeptide/tripeptide permease